MSRPPRARARVLEAARDLVRRDGAHGLTLEKLARRSGVTRSGILYHWPNRPALIQGLIAQDLEDWDRLCRQRSTSGDVVAGHIRGALDSGDGVGALAAGLLPEAREDPGAWDRVRRHHRRTFRDWAWSDDDLARYVLMLAAEGAFWRRLHGLAPEVPDLERRLRTCIETRLLEIERRPPPASAANDPQARMPITSCPDIATANQPPRTNL